MVIPDVNVLLNACHDELPFAVQSKAWLERAIAGTETIGLIPYVLSSFIRISTNSKVWQRPATSEEVLAFADLLVRSSVILEATPQYWKTFRDLLVVANASGNLVTDVSLGAYAIVHEGRMVTLDRDFHRIPGVAFVAP